MTDLLDDVAMSASEHLKDTEHSNATSYPNHFKFPQHPVDLPYFPQFDQTLPEESKKLYYLNKIPKLFEPPGNGPRITDILKELAEELINYKIKLSHENDTDLGISEIYSQSNKKTFTNEEERETSENTVSGDFSWSMLSDNTLQSYTKRLHSQLRAIINTAVLPHPDKMSSKNEFVDPDNHKKYFIMLLKFYKLYSGTAVTVSDFFDIDLFADLIRFNTLQIHTDFSTLVVQLDADYVFKCLCKKANISEEETAKLILKLSIVEEKKKSVLSSETGLGFLARDLGGALEESLGVITFECITNDRLPDHMKKLVTLKNLFSRQLPKMPRKYIVRLVFDRNHYSFCLIKQKQVIGGICFRPFFSQGFAEIAFLAVISTEQVKGYGTRLMSHLKEHVKKAGIKYFLTYADNFAVGYFRKQGFYERLTLPASQWVGFIKDYDGGTLMECQIHENINYLKLPTILREQKLKLRREIEIRNPKVRYPGLNWWKENPNYNPDPKIIPGFLEAGYKKCEAVKKPKNWIPLCNQIQAVLEALLKHENSWPFRKPVTANEAADYYSVITKPIDISTMRKKARNHQYRSKKQFGDDLKLMFDNCRLYNHTSTIYYKYANELQAFIWPKYEAIKVSE